MTDDTADTFDPPDLVPDHTDLLGFGEPDRVELIGNASVTTAGQKAECWQEVDHETTAAPLLYVSAAVENAVPVPSVDSPLIPIGRPQRRKGPGRPPKRGRPRAPGRDHRVRIMKGPLAMADRRDILDAVRFARHIGRSLNTTINFQPVHLDRYPEDQEMGRWFRNGIMRDLATFFAREKDTKGRPLRWWGFATRENYEGERREHLHVVLWCPPRLRAKLLDFLRRRYPGSIEPDQMAVHMGELDDESGLEYRLKQMQGGAAGPLRDGRPVAETRSRWDGAAVAAVYGKRYVISQTLALPARSENGWQQHQDEKRQVRAIISAAQRQARRPPTVIASTASILPAGIV